MASMTFEEFTASSELADYVQRNADIYRAKWQEMYAKAGSIEKLRTRRSWNWAAFLIGGGWFFYRKMYLIGALWAAAYVAIAVADSFTGSNHAIVYLLLNFGLAQYGNALYFHHTYDRVAKARAGGQTGSLKAQGGVTWAVAIIGSLVVYLGTGVLSVVLESLKKGEGAFSAWNLSDTPEPTKSPKAETMDTLSTQPTATPSAALPSSDRVAADLSGTYNFEESGYSGEITVAQNPDGTHAVSIKTESTADAHLCEIETSAAVKGAMTLNNGLRAVDLNWKDPDADCSINIHFFGPLGAKVSTSGNQCSGLCGTGATFEGRYSKVLASDPASTLEKRK